MAFPRIRHFKNRYPPAPAARKDRILSKIRKIEKNKQSQEPPKYEKVKFQWKKALLLLLIGIAAYAVLKTLLLYEQRYFWIIYELAAGIPIIVYIVIVRGRIGSLPTPEELSDAWSDEQKTEFLSNEKRLRDRGRVCLYIAFPFIFALMIAVITEYYIPLVTTQ